MKRTNVLLVDDERTLLTAIQEMLEQNGINVSIASSCAEAERVWKLSQPDLVVLDYALPDGNALQLIEKFKGADATVPIIVLTGHGTIDLAVKAVQAGADNFLTKPADPSTLLVIMERSLENSRNRQNRVLEESKKRRDAIDPFAGVSTAIAKLGEIAQKVARSDSSVLIQGETGTGKGILAKWLHSESGRSNGSYVDLNCAGLPRDLLESELFGHEKGAFTGAVQAKMGLFEAAHKGTLFLDEIGDVDPVIQPKLLKVLEEKRFRRLGDIRDRFADVRLIAATHRDLCHLVSKGKFRDDLYFRISTVPLCIPPLRDRKDDIPILTHNLLHRLSKEMGKSVEITDAAIEKLQGHSWPGNIRELRNVLERSILLSTSATLTGTAIRFDSPTLLNQDDAPGNIRTLEQMEREYIQTVLVFENGRVESAAKRLGISRSSLYLKLNQYGIGKGQSAAQP